MATSEDQLSLPNEKIKETLEDVIRKYGIIEYDLQISSACDIGDCLIGTVYRIKVIDKKGDDEEASLSLICKFPVDNIHMRADSFIVKAFTRESLLYQEIIPELKFFQEQLKIKDGFISVADCLATSTAEYDEFVLMKDLCSEEFYMMHRLADPSLAQVTLVMEELGKFHGICFAIRDQKPDILQNIRSKLQEMCIIRDMPETVKFVMYSMLAKSYETISVSGKYKEKWEYFHKNYLEILLSCVDTESAEPYATVCHGDLKNNNILFKYQEGEAVAVRFIDWQLSRFASPITDVMFFIFCCTNKAFRDMHYQTMLKTYHNSLTSFILKLGSDPEKLFPLSEFNKEMKKFGIYGLLMATTVMPVLLSDAHDLTEYSKSDASAMKNDVKDLYKNRLTDVLIDMVDLGYL